MNAADVFVVVHREAPALASTLAGVAAQTVRPGTVVVVHNEPDGDALDVSRAFAASLPIEIVTFDRNRGFTGGANEGIRRTRAPWVLSLNPDCRLAPDFLERLLATAQPERRCGAASGLLLRASGPDLVPCDEVDSAGMVVTRSGRHFDRGSGLPVEASFLRPAWVFGATGAAALYRREALEDVAYPGGEVFDDRFFAYREDADLAWRLQRRGWTCLFWPAARGWHARGLRPESGRRGTPEINRHSVRNRFLLRWANADWRWRVCCFPQWLLRDVVVVAACLTVERSSLPGLAEAWRARRAQLRRGRDNAARAVVPGSVIGRWFTSRGRVVPLEEPA
ncbi:MAG: glycosyltransferase family 2 protein [Acidobacteriota bacterium]